MSNTPKPLRFVYGRWRIVTPEVESCVNIPEVERRKQYVKLPWYAEVESCVNIPEVEGCAREQWVKMSGMVRLVIYYDESFDSSRIVSIRQHLKPPFTDTCVIFFKCLANRHLVWRVVICCDESFDSSRFDNIFDPLSQTLAEYFLSLLQTDFRYAFPCHKRWFLRPPVSQHHFVANRLSVWRFVNCLWQFAAVWVNWTTLAYQIGRK